MARKTNVRSPSTDRNLWNSWNPIIWWQCELRIGEWSELRNQSKTELLSELGIEWKAWITRSEGNRSLQSFNEMSGWNSIGNSRSNSMDQSIDKKERFKTQTHSKTLNFCRRRRGRRGQIYPSIQSITWIPYYLSSNTSLIWCEYQYQTAATTFSATTILSPKAHLQRRSNRNSESIIPPRSGIYDSIVVSEWQSLAVPRCHQSSMGNLWCPIIWRYDHRNRKWNRLVRSTSNGQNVQNRNVIERKALVSPRPYPNNHSIGHLPQWQSWCSPLVEMQCHEYPRDDLWGYGVVNGDGNRFKFQWRESAISPTTTDLWDYGVDLFSRLRRYYEFWRVPASHPQQWPFHHHECLHITDVGS